jgi:valyl-tRNA synthetase
MQEVELSTRYDASEVEPKWYQRWEEAGLFSPEPNSNKPAYTVTIPPPNITGSLHMGHALCYPLQDLVGRYQRMRGKSVLVLPGQDHAGIATQSVVTKKLKAEGKNPAAMERDEFLNHVWDWRKESGDTILKQFRLLGCAFDWSRQRFTLDDDYHRAVLKVFIDWFEKGLIYRGKRVINWDPALKTSVSDIETERKEQKGKLYHIRYPYADGEGHIEIATTRPETMLADVAVAVHPSDERYRGKIGKKLTLPLMNQEIPLIEDEYPDPEFGTGAVKITPAHDPNDYEVGVRHDLEMPVVLDDEAKINELGGPYQGLDRYEARKRIVADLEEQGYLIKVEDHALAVLVSDRSKQVIEPLLSEQWFVSQTDLAQPAIDVVREKKIRFVPERFEKVYLDWMLNIRDWCISRQLRWGHQIPVYYDEEDKAYAALSWEEAEAKAGRKIVRQDADVLDTWFSSGLWPFATLGWPDQTEDLQNFYPTDALITDRNIIYLWVARMIMMGMYFEREIPFKDVFIYATVLTEDGRRMSKSLGTGVDPLGVIEEKGADALRFTLLSQTGTNQDIRYSEKRTDEARNLCNKMWNAARFVLINLDGYDPNAKPDLQEIDRWILSRLQSTIEGVSKDFEAYDFQSATQKLYQFFWSELCDWYIEITKPRLINPEAKAAPQAALVQCLEAFLKMIHPIMPHITEEIYSHLPVASQSPFLMGAPWPESQPEQRNQKLEAKVETWLDVTRELRALRAELGLAAMKAVPEAYYEGDLQGGELVVKSQAWVEDLKPGKPKDKFVSTTLHGLDLHLPIGEDVGLDKERDRLAKEETKLKKELEKVQRQLENPKFVANAKPEAVEKARSQQEELQARLQKNRDRQKLFG